MAQKSLQQKLDPSARGEIKAREDLPLHETVGQVVSLAHELRYPEIVYDDQQSPVQDFGAIIRTSGRMLLLTDVTALFFAYIAGGLIARGVNVMLTGGFQIWPAHRR